MVAFWVHLLTLPLGLGPGGGPRVHTRRSLLASACGVATFSSPRNAGANWLSSRPVEVIRQLEQEAADAKYGELAPIDDGTGGGKRLAPILELQEILTTAGKDSSDPSRWKDAAATLATPRFETKAMKRAFNYYSDNVYYSDDARANIYLLGGATPESSQTEQYLLRNEVITAVQNAQKELAYLIAEAKKGDEGDTDTTDLREYLDAAQGAFKSYFERAAPRDLASARRILHPPASVASS